MVEGEGLPPQITRGKVKPVYPTKRVALVACVFVPIPENIEFLAMGRVCCQIANRHLDEIPFVKGVGTEFFSNDVGRAYVHLGCFAGHCKFCWSFSHQLSYQFRVRAHTRCIKITLATNITLLWDIRFCAPNHTDTYKSLIIYRILHVSAQLYDCRLWG